MRVTFGLRKMCVSGRAMNPKTVTSGQVSTRVWRRGSVVSSWLLDLTASALAKGPELDNYSGYVDDSGEGRWTVQEAVRLAVPAHVLSAALYARFSSRQQDAPAMKVIAALRNQFGGHAVKK